MPVSFTVLHQDIMPSRWNSLLAWILSLISFGISNTTGRSDRGRQLDIDREKAGHGSNGRYDTTPRDHVTGTLFFIIGLVAVPLSIATAQAGTVTLAWNASSGASGYRVYYGQASGNYTSNAPTAPSLVTATTYTTPDLAAGTYYFAVKAFDSTGNSSNYSNEVSTTIAAATVVVPTANFGASPTSGVAPLTVKFTDSSANATAWSWDFGDGTTPSTRQNPWHTYATAGTYTVSLTATGPGGSNTTSKSNFVSVASATATAPVASFSASPGTTGNAPFTVTLTDTSTGNISSRTWDFGDGSPITTVQSPQTFVKTYDTTTPSADYTVTLTVTGSGVSNKATKTITASAVVPVANFIANATSGVVPLATTFTNTSTGTITSYSWSFGDGGTSTTPNPSYTYAKVGTYTVKLTATGPAGSNTSTKTGYVTVSAEKKEVGLVAAYNFEETDGATTALDASGNGNHGIISGATRTTSGKYGKALSFDGDHDWVTINDSASLDLTTSVTVEAWVYPNNLDSGWWYCVLAKDHSGGASYYLAASSDRNQPEFGIGTEDWAWNKLYGGPSLLQPNAWIHLAATYDGAVQRLYVNGNQVSSRSQSGRMMVSNGALRIGGSGTWSEFFRGRIDDIRIYNRALSASEIRADMNTAVQ